MLRYEFTALAMIPMKEGTKMLMSYECGDKVIVESLLFSMLFSRVLSLVFSPSFLNVFPSLIDDDVPKSH